MKQLLPKWISLQTGLLGLFVVMVSHPVAAQVVINEVMFNPSGSEFYDEYVELFNAGDSSVDLSGWRLGDSNDTDAIVDVEMGLVLGPKQYALILDPDYFENSNSYGSLPEDVLIVSLDGATFGRGGFQNEKDESVVLISDAGQVVATMTYRTPNVPGFSEEKINPLAGDGSDNWVDAKWVGGSPGRVNSVSMKPTDLLLRSEQDSVYVPWMGSVPLTFWVINEGFSDIPEFRVEFGQESTIEDLVGSFLAVGDSTRLTVDVQWRKGGVGVIQATGRVAGDGDVSNDALIWTVVNGYALQQVVINEVMAAPTEGEEWVELLNLSADDIDLQGWQLADERTSGVISGGTIAGHGFFVLRQLSEEGKLSRWPTLNNGGDVLVLKDATGSMIDSVTYPAATADVSLERIDPMASGMLVENWLASTQTATPDAPNSVAFVAVDHVALLAEPNPFEAETRIQYSLPVARAHVSLRVFDRMGRKVRDLLVAEEGGAKRDVVWNGRGDHQQILKPGVFVLYLEARSPDGQTFSAKTPLVLSRGLNN